MHRHLISSLLCFRRLNYRTIRCLFVIKKYLMSLLNVSNNTKYYRT
ncbi:hypothetical protein HMPREF9088_1835 [Enterococcus italicus DSM 15952]|uniref:Uncharacterized protein n=1 Tax=Enterococcus italicus (strain DSM 15952 / CCUG 50447 / LMG 22039 / TP 1.5) TaxID=888064 RepID=E6LHJ5_ENTI1|nr:hypothetical protein HMPREF9088_1835 [Enterococcus italicus DSM 15952]